MRALDFWKAVTVDAANLVEVFIRLLETHGIRYCVVGGQAVNAYVEPLVSLDLDLVIAAEQFPALEALLSSDFKVERFPHSLNISRPGSDVRIQFQTDPRYAPFVARASRLNVLGLLLPVARIDDVLQGKSWAAQDRTRRGSKRQKDLADIARLVEAYPNLRDQVPAEILQRLA